VQGIAALAAGSTGDVQFNNGGALAGSSNLFWNNRSGYLRIRTAAPRMALDTWTGTLSGAENDYKQAQYHALQREMAAEWLKLADAVLRKRKE
jgi:hypothetical protein